MIVTGIGSRKIDIGLYQICLDLAQILANKGWHLRSGGAIGADTAWEVGFSESNHKTIYLPEPNFNGRPNTGCFKVPSEWSDVWFEAQDIARRIHPRFDEISEFGQNAHTRNVFQVLGDDLKTKSDIVIACAEPKGRTVKGGTATAYSLAKAHGIDCFNLWVPQDRERLYELYAKELLAPVGVGRDLFLDCTDSPDN